MQSQWLDTVDLRQICEWTELHSKSASEEHMNVFAEFIENMAVGLLLNIQITVVDQEDLELGSLEAADNLMFDFYSFTEAFDDFVNAPLSIGGIMGEAKVSSWISPEGVVRNFDATVQIFNVN